MEPKRKRAKTTRPPPPPASAAAISQVLGNDDLLREILLRLGFPTCLVRAAAVSRRWLRHASDPAFLRRFRDLHPPRLPGFYLHTESGFSHRLRFVPMPRQHPELAAVVRRGRFDLGDAAHFLSDCRNGRLIVRSGGMYSVFSPLHPARGAAAVPALYKFPKEIYRPLLPEGAGDRTVVALVCSHRGGWVHVSESQPGAWGKLRASHLIELPEEWRMSAFGLLAYGKLYLFGRYGYILGIDLASRTFFHIELPHGVEYKSSVDFELSRAEDSRFYLIDLKDFKIRVWLHSTGCSVGNWELVESISLNQALGHLANPAWLFRDPAARLVAVGDNADFVFVQIEGEIFYLHIWSKAMEKVYELKGFELEFDIHPSTMVWPPTFPALNDGCVLVK